MAYEVDVLAVGEKSSSGDAIALRYGDLSRRESHRVVVIDGGFRENGEALVRLIRGVYGTSRVDTVISTHPDADHSSGLEVVLEELQVGALWMHKPWDHSPDVRSYVRNGVGSKNFDEQLEKSIDTARELHALAQRNGIPIIEPFAGVRSPDQCLTVLGPTCTYYEELLANFEERTASALMRILRGESLFKGLVEGAAAKMRELWDDEVLVEPAANSTRPQNNSSAVVYASLDGKGFLFTGDAGVPALERAVSPQIASLLNGSLHYLQVPHHGSKRNVGPAILDRLLGPKVPEGTKTGKIAFISAAAAGDPKHPSKRVTNAANRRGATVVATQGSNLYMHSAGLGRADYVAATPIAFAVNYDEDD